MKPTPNHSWPTFIKRALLLCISGLSSLSLLAADVSGEWEFAGKSFGDISYARVTLKTDENGKLTGRLNELKLEGSIKGDELSFAATRPNGDHFGDFTCKLVGEKLEATAIWPGMRK